jgi:N-glycosylase/DNA lyase
MTSRFINYQGINELADKVRNLTNDKKVKETVDKRIREFREVYYMDSYKWFQELVYCLLTAYSSAQMGGKCLLALYRSNFLLDGSLKDIEACLRIEGHRFASRRAKYIYDIRDLAPVIKKKIINFKNSKEAREWLVKNVKGIGWKEASHYLRNVGYFDLAILDRHILRNMIDFNLVDIEDMKKGLTKKRYLRYEEILSEVANRLMLSLGELDLYLWYIKTGKILK